ncbi:MAG: hypothetical protein IJX28_08545 [Clostridia bacterium]|nr:hypothetical protein [Clostridia bacterium]
MKNQQNAIKTRKLSLLAVALVTLALLLCSFTMMVSAAAGDITIGLEDVKIDLDQDVSGKYTKVFDNTTNVTVTLTASNEDLGIAAGDDVTVVVNAAYNSANVADATHITVTFALEGADAAKYQTPAGFTVGASITPKALTWADKATSKLTYKVGQSAYTAEFSLPALNGVVAGSELPFKTDAKHSLTLQATKVGTYTELYNPNVGTNYQVAPLTVEVTIDPVTVTEIKWANEYEFTYGDAAAKELVVEAVGSDGATYQLVVTYPAAYGSAGWHEISVSSPDAGIVLGTDLITSKKVNIKPITLAVFMNSASFVGNADTAQNPSVYQLVVSGDLPAELREKIQYTVDGKAFAGTSAYGIYTVVAKLPADSNYVFVDGDGKEVTELTATLTVNRAAAAFGTPEAPYQVVLTGTNGVAANIQATVSIPQALNKKALGDLTTYKAYVVAIANAGEESYQILIPISDTLVHPSLNLITADDLYIYDAVGGTMVKATQAGYQVAVTDGYFTVSGLVGDISLTFVLAPSVADSTSFWFTAPGIAILILLVIILILLIILIVREKNRKDEPVEEPAEEELPTDEEFLEELAEEVAEELAEEVAAEEPAEAEAENVEETVEETMEELNEAPAEEDNTVAEEIADQVAETLEEEVVVEEAEAEATEEDLQNAVSSAMEETLASDESVEAFAEVDDDDDKDDEGDSFGAFAGMDLNFIDVKEQPEEYAALLEQEKNGEVQLVTRYRRSYQSRLIQSQGNVQDYYTILKNALLSYKGVKSRISWNYEAFNKGRAHVAKLNAKTKTLYLYLALNPEELVDTKYGIVDVSSKKKYASVPVLMKIKGDRKFKYALELIDKLCAEQMELPKKANAEEVDYHMPYQTLEEMVESGVVKMLVAGVPLTQTEDEAVADTAVETESDANVSFVAPADAPAVVAAAEEVAAEEEAVEVAAEAEAPAADAEETTEA